MATPEPDPLSERLASAPVGRLLASTVFAEPVTAVFTDDPATRELGTSALGVIALSYPFAGIVGLAAAWFQSLGRPWPSLALSLGTLLLVRLPILLALSLGGLDGVWWSYPVGEALAACVAWVALSRATRARPAV
ncbi:MAG: hypothetical protein L0G22_09800 [Propionibacteriaceae bacterium]|nr:hypothetical protein [Propionibacteriaceae bacterium]